MEVFRKNHFQVGLLMIAITASLFLCVVLPFLPGDFDPIAMQISLMVQSFSVIGIITCLPAVVWLFDSIKNRTTLIDVKLSFRQKRFARIYIYTSFLVSLTLVLMTTLTFSLSFGILFLIGLILSAKLTLKKLINLHITPIASFVLPLFLTLIPISLLIFQLIVNKPLTQWGRNLAIENSKTLIADIERWKSTYGKYPPTLNAVHKDYHVGIKGIEKFHYSFDDTSYNLYFEQPKFLLDQFGTREFVVYNPNEGHLMISHASWNTRWNPKLIRATQRWYSSGNLRQPHWRYFWFD